MYQWLQECQKHMRVTSMIEFSEILTPTFRFLPQLDRVLGCLLLVAMRMLHPLWDILMVKKYLISTQIVFNL